MGYAVKYWSDILAAIDDIESFVHGIDSLNAYVADRKTRSAVERQLAIIGEAIRHLVRIDPDLDVGSARQIVGMRNRLIHSYDNVDDRIVWKVVRESIPALKVIANERIKEGGPDKAPAE